MKFADKILAIDRRWIFLLVLLAVVIPLLVPLGLPISYSPPVKKVFDKVNELPEGSYVLLSFDFGPGASPELSPMAYALVRHCFAKNHKVLAMTLNADGAGLAENIISTTVDEMSQSNIEGAVSRTLVNGQDYVFLGYKAGVAIVILNLGENFTETFPTDYNGIPTSNQPIFREIKGLGDLDLLVDISSSATPEIWIAYGKERYKFDMAVGCTAVSATQYYPYLNTGQILGLIGGLKGAAEYEHLIIDSGYYHKVGKATIGMDAQSVVHLMTVIMVVFANIVFFMRKRGRGSR